MIPYGRQHITQEDEQAVLAALRSDYLTQGPAVEEFEKKFAEYVGAKYALAVTNGTAALHLAALALNVGPGDKVLVPANTFVASANCILYCGGDVEFVDIDPRTLCLDLNILEEKLKSKPKGYYKGVVAVDFAGYPINLEHLKNVASKHGIWIIEDACHAPGASFKASNGQWYKSGSGEWADVSVFSFHPVKHIACGEGGMVTTNDFEIYKRIKKLRTHGITKEASEIDHYQGGWFYEMQELGFNYRMPDILCALGSSQLKRATERLKKRQQIAAFYDSSFNGMPIKIPFCPDDVKHAYHLYVIEVENRKRLYDALKAKQIFTQVHYVPVYDHPFYKRKYGAQSLHNTSTYYSNCLSIPMYPELTEEQLSFIVKSIGECL